MTEKPLCWVPYYTAELNPVGGKACCKHHNVANPYQNLSQFHSSAADSWRSASFMGESLPSECSSCDRPSGEFTYREFQHESFLRESWTKPESAQLRLLRIALDNVCASSCTQCGAHFSTTIGQLLRRDPDPRFKHDTDPGRLVTDLTQLDGQLGDLEWLHIWGGEPLFSPRVPEFIQMLREQAPKLRKITFNTGLRSIKESTVEEITSLARDRDMECWISISVDGDRELNPWIRGISDAEFDRGMSVLSKYRKYWQQSTWSVCVGAFNAFALPETLAHLADLEREWRFSNVLITPIHTTPILNPQALAINQLPPEVRAASQRKILDQLDRIKSHNYNPKYRRPEIVNTVLGYLAQESTSPWEDTEFLANRMPRLRGHDRDLAYYINHYLKDYL